MNRPVILFAAFFLLSMSAAHAGRLLVDDFSIDQQGIETGRNAAFALLEDDRLFGGGREIWGGGASVEGNCENSTYSVTVADGLMTTSVTPDCFGSGNVIWPGFDTDAALDLSAFGQLQIEIAEIKGEILTRVTIDSNVSGNSRFDVSLSTVGLHSFSLPEEAVLSSVRSITIASLVEAEEFIALDTVWLAVPEPSSLVLITSLLYLSCYVVRPFKFSIQ